MTTPRLININYFRPESRLTGRKYPQRRIAHNEKPWRLLLGGAGLLHLGVKDFATWGEAMGHLRLTTAYSQPHRKAA